MCDVQRDRVHVVVGCYLEGVPAHVSLGYDTGEPFAVTMCVLGTASRWQFARELLVAGALAPPGYHVGEGDVQVGVTFSGKPHPSRAVDPFYVVIWLTGESEDGDETSASISIHRVDVEWFLELTTSLVPYGQEEHVISIDDEIRNLLG